MRKILPIMVVAIMVLSGLGAVAIKIDDKTCRNYNMVFTLFEDELDQYQTETTENLTIPIGQIPINESTKINIQLAQSFIPTKDIITRVELLIGKNSTTTYPLIVSIRKELIEEDLVSVNVNPDQVPTEDYDWVFADFNDIHLTIGQTYYIVTITQNITDNLYAWYGNNITESYPYGCLWYSIDDGNTWGNESSSSNQNNMAELFYQNSKPRFDENLTWDMCFKTYGRASIAPGAPTISGQKKGKTGNTYEYIFNSADPDGDYIKYIIDWGDENSIETDFNASGEDVKISHTWSEKGTYYIKAKAEDIGGLVGPEATLEVKMPRFRMPESALLERFSNLFPVLQKILGLLT